MRIENIIRLADIIRAIEWKVAMQSYPDDWFTPTRDIQWYIDANWLIRAGDLIYDPR